MNHTPGENERTTAAVWLPRLNIVVGDYEAFPWISIELIAAIVSRETWWGWAPGYEPKGDPAGKGDNGHGHGFFQIDNRSHSAFLANGSWVDPCTSCRYAIERVLLPGRAYIARRFPLLSENEKSRAAIAAYNCGAGNVRRAINTAGFGAVDGRTAGKDYSKDVLDLMKWWGQWMKGEQNGYADKTED